MVVLKIADGIACLFGLMTLKNAFRHVASCAATRRNSVWKSGQQSAISSRALERTDRRSKHAAFYCRWTVRPSLAVPKKDSVCPLIFSSTCSTRRQETHRSARLPSLDGCAKLAFRLATSLLSPLTRRNSCVLYGVAEETGPTRCQISPQI